MKQNYKKILITFILLTGVFIWWKNLDNKFYNSIYRISGDEVKNLLNDTTTNCSKISECKLLPGDILVRRYITERTREFDELLNPYFTHSAVYLGNDELFEVLGNDGLPQDQIQVTKLSKSQWINDDMKTFVVIRPKNYNDKLDESLSSLRNIANDPEYVFGVPKNNNKRTTCADVIVKTLQKEKIINELYDEPEIITPDYLFLITNRDRTNFDIVGYN